MSLLQTNVNEWNVLLYISYWLVSSIQIRGGYAKSPRNDETIQILTITKIHNRAYGKLPLILKFVKLVNTRNEIHTTLELLYFLVSHVHHLTTCVLFKYY